MADTQEEINSILMSIILQDDDMVLKAIIESFDVDTQDEPVFELCFKNEKFKCAKMIFDKGVSETQLYKCTTLPYLLSNNQLEFLIEYCNVNSKLFPKEVYTKYLLAFNKTEPKEQKGKRKMCIIL